MFTRVTSAELCYHHGIGLLANCSKHLQHMHNSDSPCVELAVPSVKGTHMWYLYTKSFVLLELSPGFKLHHFIFWLPILVHGSCSVIQLPHESLAFIRLCHRTACKTPPDVPSQRSTAPFLRMYLSFNVFFLSFTPIKYHTSCLHIGTVRCACLTITLNSLSQALPKWKPILFTKVYIVAVSSERLRRHGYLVPQDFAFNPSRTVHRKVAREYKRQLELTQHALPSELLVFINKVSCPYQHNLHHCKNTLAESLLYCFQVKIQCYFMSHTHKANLPKHPARALN